MTCSCISEDAARSAETSNSVRQQDGKKALQEGQDDESTGEERKGENRSWSYERKWVGSGITISEWKTNVNESWSQSEEKRRTKGETQGRTVDGSGCVVFLAGAWRCL